MGRDQDEASRQLWRRSGARVATVCAYLNAAPRLWLPARPFPRSVCPMFASQVGHDGGVVCA